MTQEALATALGIATKNLQRLESGRQNLTLRTIEAIAAALAVPPIDLLREPAATAHGRVTDIESLEASGLEFVPTETGLPQPAGTVPAFAMSVAAGPLDGSGTPEPLAWVTPPARSRWPRSSFLARVFGHSMEPLVPNGSWVVFAGDAQLREGLTALVQHRAVADADTGASYALKRIGKLKQRKQGGLAIDLEPANRRYRTTRVLVDHAEELRVIGRLVEVIGDAQAESEHG